MVQLAGRGEGGERCIHIFSSTQVICGKQFKLPVTNNINMVAMRTCKIAIDVLCKPMDV